jgi:polar amino acid transport system ATP-binding protein
MFATSSNLQTVIKVDNARKNFRGRAAVDGVSFTAEEGDLVVLIGPSGCGKSTLLRCLNGLETLDGGRIDVYGTVLVSPQDVSANELRKRAQRVRQKVGMVFQSFNLFPHLTILENMMIAPQVVQGRDADEAEATALGLLAKVGLTEQADHYPSELSGGQQQRAAIARALAMSPKILLYDEPTSALDPMLVDEVLRVMKQLDQEGMTQIVVTHEMRFARQVADRVLYIDGGKIVEQGPPEQIFVQPQDDRTRQFLRHFL